MNKKIIAMIVLLMVLSTAASASAVVSVGVKKGDWIEYNVTYTGTPPEGEGHDVNWARLEVLDVQGAEITLNITTVAPNGATSSQTQILNLENGDLGDDFMIPANLKDGDIFFDARDGNITVGSAETRTYADASRVVVIGTMRQAVDYWDQSTGVLLEGITTLSDYSMIAKVDKTNLWQTGLDPTILIVLAIVAIVIAVAALVLVASRRKK
jgi:hypothetical protein